MKDLLSKVANVCWVVYIVLVVMPIFGSASLREIVAKAAPLSHRALSVTPLKTVTAISALQCAKLCIQHQCQSFNFAKPSNCELLDTYLCKDNLVLEVRFGYMYYDLEWSVDIQIANDFRQLSDCIDQGRCSPKCYNGTTTTQTSTMITTTQSTTAPSTTSATTTTSSTTTSTTVAPTTTSTTSTAQTTTTTTSTTTTTTSIPPTTTTTTTTSSPTTTTTTTSTKTTTVAGVPVNSPCTMDSQCLVTFTSCRQSTCLCLPGYSYKPSAGTCVTIGTCGTLGTTFTVTVDYYINGNNLAIFDIYNQNDCELECVANPSCHSFDYNWMSLTCYIAGVTKLDVSASYWTNDVSFEYYQRNCA